MLAHTTGELDSHISERQDDYTRHISNGTISERPLLFTYSIFSMQRHTKLRDVSETLLAMVNTKL